MVKGHVRISVCAIYQAHISKRAANGRLSILQLVVLYIMRVSISLSEAGVLMAIPPIYTNTHISILSNCTRLTFRQYRRMDNEHANSYYRAERHCKMS